MQQRCKKLKPVTMSNETVKVEVVSPTGIVEQPTAEDKKVAEAQAEQLYGKAEAHAPNDPGKFPSSGAPPAQGPNLSKEEEEFAAASATNPKAEEVPVEKTPAPKQASNQPVAPAGKTKK